MDIKIGELARRTECRVVTIRYYEKERLLPKPRRSQGNFRLYGEEHVERLLFIRHCRSLEMTLNEVRALLSYRDTPNLDCDGVNILLDTQILQIEARVNELLQLKKVLLTLRKRCSGSRVTKSCGVLRELSDCSCNS